MDWYASPLAKQVVLVKAGDKVGPVLGEYSRQTVQDDGKVRHQHRHIPVKQGVGDTTGEKGLAGSHIPEQQQAGILPVGFLPMLLPHGIAGASRLAGQRAQFVQVTIIQRPQPGQLAMGLLPAVQTAMLDCWWIFNIRVVALWI